MIKTKKSPLYIYKLLLFGSFYDTAVKLKCTGTFAS